MFWNTMPKLSLPLIVATVAFAQPAPSEKPVALIPGLGTYTHTIATRSTDAQKYFNQGLNLLYGFNRYEALRSFRRASELDPTAAMSHWGIPLAPAPPI